MPSYVFWRASNKVLYVKLEGIVSLKDFKSIDHQIVTAFDTRAIGHQIALVVDITELKQVPTAYSQLKATQTYLSRPELRAVLVAGNNKLLRLMMMLIFNLSKPTLRFFDSVAQALEFAESRIPA